VFVSGTVLKLGDFGIARMLKATCDMAFTAVGTPYYLCASLTSLQTRTASAPNH